jgi:hypothetical protein
VPRVTWSIGRTTIGEAASLPRSFVELEKQDRVSGRIKAGGERCQHSAGVAAETRECRGRGGDRASVAAGIGDEQDHVDASAVALLSAESSLERLEVIENRLGLDRQEPGGAADHEVPRAQVAICGERDLRPTHEAGMEPNSQTLEEALLPGVPNRVSRRIAAKDEVEPDRSAPRTEVAERDVIDQPLLEPQNLLM